MFSGVDMVRIGSRTRNVVMSDPELALGDQLPSLKVSDSEVEKL